MAIYYGLLPAKEMVVIADLVCYSDSLHCINLIKGHPIKFHTYAVLIQDIKELIDQINVTICHTLREWNQCADSLAKLGASSYIDFSFHTSPPEDLRSLLKIDTTGTFFSRVLFVLLFFIFFFLF